MKREVVKIEWLAHYDIGIDCCRITVRLTHTPTHWLDWLFPSAPETLTRTYQGGKYVWRVYPEGNRADLNTEGWLNEIYSQEAWKFANRINSWHPSLIIKRNK